MLTRIKTDTEIQAMRTSGRLLAEVLAALRKDLRPGMSTLDLDGLAVQTLKGTGGKPAFLGMYGFPNTLCVSVNDEVVHGIPKQDRIISDGDIVSMDFGVIYDGMITDAAISVIAGTSADPKDVRLVRDTQVALEAGIDAIKAGCKVGDIAHAVESSLDGRYGIVRDLVGHGVGHLLHEEPNIPNYGKPGTGMKLEAGMTIAIEPMVTLGTYKVLTDVDGWTIKTQDGARAAHFEHTILITDTGAEILTIL